MGLETGTYITDLVGSNPVSATDPVNQGDDHLRLIKNVLKNTFPGVNRAVRFSAVSAVKTSAFTVTAADENTLFLLDSTSGDFTVTLPLASSVFEGFSVSFVLVSNDINVITVIGSSGQTIDGLANATISQLFEGLQLIWTAGTWRILARFGLPHTFIKTTSSDQFLSNSTVLRDDAQLFIPLVASKIYHFDAIIGFSGPSAADVKFAFTVPAGATLRWAVSGSINIGVSDTIVPGSIITTSGGAISMGINPTGRSVRLEGVVINGSTEGNLQLQWAQNVADPGGITIFKQSMLRIWRV